MAWKIDLDPEAERELSKLDAPIARRIFGFLSDRLATLEDPRTIGEALKGSRLGDFWKYRVVITGSLLASKITKYVFLLCASETLGGFIGDDRLSKRRRVLIRHRCAILAGQTISISANEPCER